MIIKYLKEAIFLKDYGRIRCISIIHPKSKKRYSICDFEKKCFFDLIKIVAYNIEQEMTKAFSSYYTKKDC